MKIVDRKTFLAMPAGTVFAKYQPVIFGELTIKGHSVGPEPVDYYEQRLIEVDANDLGGMVDRLDLSQQTGYSVPLDFYCSGRDGLFDEDQLFAVFEPHDVEALILRLQQALRDSTSPAPVTA